MPLTQADLCYETKTAISKWLLLGSGVVRPGPGNEVEDLWCASESERR